MDTVAFLNFLPASLVVSSDILAAVMNGYFLSSVYAPILSFTSGLSQKPSTIIFTLTCQVAANGDLISTDPAPLKILLKYLFI